MTRRPLFWIVFASLSALGLLFAFRFFAAAFPLLTLDISMDRSSALDEAASLASRYGWEPTEFRQASSFGQVDPEVQTYVELEAGGPDAFLALSEDGIYSPYVWSVRHFAEGTVQEARLRFTPAGAPYGFRLTLAEDDPGSGNLDAEQARDLAAAAAREWGVDLSSFELLETSTQTLPGGRVDHGVVFQRTDVQVAEARFRLRIEVSGDRVSEVTHFVHVPEAFSRRYADMRSDNDLIALVAQTVFMLVFVLCAGGVGTVLLLRHRWVLWKAAVAWGGVTALLMGLSVLNALPLSWMGYDTAVSARVFLLQQLAAAGAFAVLGTPVLGSVYLAGESLGRRAFPEHLQQWRFWSSEVAASNPALGRTVAAYLFLGLELGYVVAFYLGTSRLEGWWAPAEALVQPDFLAMVQPWLSAVATSLFAAFWEESVFRAVPIAGAALLGLRFGRRNAWIWGAVILQALVFAASHANYPQQPPYARAVELFLPAFGWGAVYVYFGLVPTILAHYTYDLALFSLPLFASDAPGIWTDRALVGLAAVIPLAIVVRARLRGRARAAAPAWAYNGAWSPPPIVPAASEGAEASTSGNAVPSPPSDVSLPGAALAAMGLVGAGLWLAVEARRELPPRLESGRDEVVAAARAMVEERDTSDKRWRAMPITTSDRGDGYRYVLEEGGEDAYRSLEDRYLPGPQWLVRFADFDADPAERVEEYRVRLAPDGTVERVRHILPEARPGARLTAEEARAEALAFTSARFGLAPADLDEVAAEETSRPDRSDWTFTFSDRAALSELDGDARIGISLAGREVVDAHRFVHVPEEWSRARRERTSRWGLVSGAVTFMAFLVFATAAVLAVLTWSRGPFAVGFSMKLMAAAATILSVTALNEWPVATALFSTEQPWGLQAGVLAVGIVLIALVASGGLALTGGLAHTWLPRSARSWSSPWPGAALGLAVAGAASVAGALAPGGLPAWPDYANAAAFLPALSAALNPLLSFITLTVLLLLLTSAGIRSRDRPLAAAAVVAATLVAAMLVVPSGFQNHPVLWMGTAVAAGAVLSAILRLTRAQPAMVPGLAAALVMTGQVSLMRAAPYPGSVPGAAAALLVVGIAAWWWTRALGRAEPRLDPAG